MMDEHNLTSEEKMAFQNLPKGAEPSRILEERIVRSLQEEGILGQGGNRASHPMPSTTSSRWFRPWMAAAAVAASLALFASGVVMGQWMGSQSTTQAFIQVREQDASQLALRIQEAGSAYVSALAAMSELRTPAPGREEVNMEASVASMGLQQGQEVALGALYGAANELARMSPDDMDLLRVLQILEERRAREEGWGGEDRNVVWF